MLLSVLAIAASGRALPQQRPAGVVRHEEAAFDGYTLFAPLKSTTTFLIDMQGEAVHRWASDLYPGAAVYLLDGGRVLRCGREPEVPVFFGGGQGGRIQEIAADGAVLWDYRFADATHLQHHDVEPLPDGNVLLIAWERKTPQEAVAAGRHPDTMRYSEFWPDLVAEVRPLRPDSGEVVWEWHVWDHLIQDLDPTQANYGDVAGSPGRVDINADVPEGGPAPRTPRLSDAERERLEALGYLGGGDPRGEPRADWTHVNSIDYHPEQDLILLSVRRLHEVWVIDHSTTTEEAASSQGGRRGVGGDLVARYGHPSNLRREGERLLFDQHDAHWIEPGRPGAGHILLFNNGVDRRYSSVDEVELPADGDPFGPWPLRWSYTAAEPTDFLAGHVSGAQRLPNGNTLICDGVQARFFEVTSAGEVVWDYWSPFGDTEQAGDFPGGVFRATRIAPDDPRLAALRLER